MNQTFKKFLALTLLCVPGAVVASASTSSCSTSACSTSDTCVTGLPFFNRRSEGFRSYFDSLGWNSMLATDCDLGTTGAVEVHVGGGRSFNSTKLAKMLSFNGAQTMNVGAQGGTGVDIAAPFLLLPNDFTGTLTLNPVINNVVIRFNGYFDFCCWCDGLFGRFSVPVNWTKYQLGLCEKTTAAGTATMYNGELGTPVRGDDPALLSMPNTTIIQALQGTSVVASNGDAVSTYTTPWKFGKWDNNGRDKTAVADIVLELGYNFINCEDRRFGLGFLVSCPTGNEPNGEFFFEPIVGQTKEWGLGGNITGDWKPWSCDDASLAFILDANIYTMLSAKQRRSFDFTVNGAGSRYLLVKEYTPGDGGTYSASNNTLTAVNLSTVCVKVKNSVQVDASLTAAYETECWGFSVGYNAWYRSKDKICLADSSCATSCPTTASTATSTKKYGFFSTSTAAGQTFGSGNLGADYSTNGIDYTAPKVTISGKNGRSDTATNLVQVSGDGAVTDGSGFIDFTKALNMCGQSGFSNTVFADLHWTFEECECFQPFLSIGGDAEFGSCSHPSLSQWQVWISGGIGF